MEQLSASICVDLGVLWAVVVRWGARRMSNEGATEAEKERKRR